MAQNLYITAMEPQSGKSIAALGLMELLATRVERLGFFRPIVSSDTEPDAEIELIRARDKGGEPDETVASVRAARAALEHKRCSIFGVLMCLADRVLVYGDCAVNPQPTPEQLADIAISSAETVAAFGIEPRIAMLSYSTGESAALGRRRRDRAGAAGAAATGERP